MARSPPPTEKQISALRQTLLVGLVDGVAKKVAPGAITEGSRRRRLTAYQSCHENITDYLYIHPSSACYQADPSAPLPEYVTFASLTRSGSGETVYMNTVTPISPGWLRSVLGGGGGGGGHRCPLLRYAPPLTAPPPFYDVERDQICCYSMPTYGVHRWELPAVVLPLHTALELSSSSSGGGGVEALPYMWFGRFLLEGRIIPSSMLLSASGGSGGGSGSGTSVMKEPASLLLPIEPRACSHCLCTSALVSSAR